MTWRRERATSTLTPASCQHCSCSGACWTYWPCASARASPCPCTRRARERQNGCLVCRCRPGPRWVFQVPEFVFGVSPHPACAVFVLPRFVVVASLSSESSSVVLYCIIMSARITLSSPCLDPSFGVAESRSWVPRFAPVGSASQLDRT